MSWREASKDMGLENGSYVLVCPAVRLSASGSRQTFIRRLNSAQASAGFVPSANSSPSDHRGSESECHHSRPANSSADRSSLGFISVGTPKIFGPLCRWTTRLSRPPIRVGHVAGCQTITVAIPGTAEGPMCHFSKLASADCQSPVQRFGSSRANSLTRLGAGTRAHDQRRPRRECRWYRTTAPSHRQVRSTSPARCSRE